MKTHELIEGLVREARPVRRMPDPSALASLFVLGALPAIALVAWGLEWREDLQPHLVQAWFYLVTGSFVVASLAASGSFLTLALPGRRGFGKGLAVAAVLLAAIVGFWLSRTPWVIVTDSRAWVVRGVQCVTCAMLLAAIPGVAGLWLLRRGAPVRPGLAGAALGVAVGVLGSAGIGWVCDWDEPAHVLIAHVLIPLGILAGLGALVGRRWLRW